MADPNRLLEEDTRPDRQPSEKEMLLSEIEMLRETKVRRGRIIDDKNKEIAELKATLETYDKKFTMIRLAYLAVR